MIRSCLQGIWILLIGISVQAQVLIRDQDEELPAGTKVEAQPGTLNFLVIGDWGRNGEDHQKLVAAQMGRTATQVKADFIVSTGDNFYPSGVISEHDPLFFFSFENIYTDFSLQWDWYVTLGNHDYKSDPDAQVRYTNISRR
ncbi:MAG TPA: metallophosphoesterase, partial [Phnomibacter sp.]|nr:metallophosphoesterase [Phnomibacter sp.]